MLKITLQENYKSFQNGFNFTFDGKLIILSGVNGSGKSQLLDIIRQKNPDSKVLNAQIVLNGVQSVHKDVVYRSFKDAIEPLKVADYNTLKNSKNQIWNYYNNYLLDFNRTECLQFAKSCEKAKLILINKFGETQFVQKRITNEDVKNAIPDNFIWETNDIFTNCISEIFFHHAFSELHDRAEKRISQKEAPWNKLNSLFGELNLEYRFEDDFRIKDNTADLNKQPKLYHIQEDGSLDLLNPRELNDLSDGEKVILALTFASLSGVDNNEKKILLLDEFDATLNPSLIEMFFTILDRFFLQKGICVIMVTHSSDTIFLASERSEATFYEVYKPKSGVDRIVKIERIEEYNELAEILKKEWNERSLLQSKIATLNTKLNDILSGSQKKLVIFTEGRNNSHIQQAIKILDITLLEVVEVVNGVEDKTGDVQLKTAFEMISKSNCIDKKFLFVWDCDSSSKVESLVETEKCKKFAFQKNEENTKVKKGIENLYEESFFVDDFYIPKTTKDDYGGGCTRKEFDKNKCLNAVRNNQDVMFFKNYNPLLQKIRGLLT